MEPTLTYGLVSIGAGVIVLLIRYSFKSKCTDVSLCFGLIRIQRDVEQEVEEQKIEGPKKELSLRQINNV
jgi:hypothetical protein